jgi:hypothetical protein
MGDWEPDRTLRTPDQNPVFVWIVPASVAGEWTLDASPLGAARLRLEQQFQRVRGVLAALGGGGAIALEGRLDGARLSLSSATGAAPGAVATAGAAQRRLELLVDGDLLLSLPGTQAVGRRLR